MNWIYECRIKYEHCLPYDLDYVMALYIGEYSVSLTIIDQHFQHYVS